MFLNARAGEVEAAVDMLVSKPLAKVSPASVCQHQDWSPELVRAAGCFPSLQVISGLIQWNSP
jgi:hypothetical protein